jgi:hypothetical protein
MWLTFTKHISHLFANKEMCIFMVGLDANSKMMILYKLKLGKIVTTIPTIGEFFHFYVPPYVLEMVLELHCMLSHVFPLFWLPLVGAPLKVLFTLFMPFSNIV